MEETLFSNLLSFFVYRDVCEFFCIYFFIVDEGILDPNTALNAGNTLI